MTTPKFLDIIVSGYTITVNKSNIATFEFTGSGAKIKLNITDDNGKYIEYKTSGIPKETDNPLFTKD